MKRYALWLTITFCINATTEIPDFSAYYQKNHNGNLYSVPPATAPPQKIPEYMYVRNRILAMTCSHRLHRFNHAPINPAVTAHWQGCILLQQNAEYQMLVQQKRTLERNWKAWKKL